MPRVPSPSETVRPDPAPGGERRAGRGRFDSQPFRLFVVTTLSVLAAEAVIMGILETAFSLPGELEIVADSLTLVAVLLPLLYLFLFRPMASQIAERRRAEEALRHAQEGLEHRVAERTAELAVANRELRQEVDERRRAEAALRASEQKYSTLVENSLTGTFIHQGGRVVFANQQCSEILGYRREVLEGMQTLALVHPDDRPRLAELARRRLRGEAVAEDYETRATTRAGEAVWVNVRAVRIVYRGSPAILGNILDITRRKMMEQALAESQGQLRRLSARLLTAQEVERARIARELHDGIGQSLSAIKFTVEGALSGLDGNGAGPHVAMLRALIPRVQETVEEVRRISMALRPSTLDDLGLLATIGWFCREFQQTHRRLKVERRVEVVEEDVPERLKTVIYRVLQEAMNNVAKHSRAGRVEVSLRRSSDLLELGVADDGGGFDARDLRQANRETMGFGLSSMRERTELSGGWFSLESAVGSGTVVRACWPPDAASD